MKKPSRAAAALFTFTLMVLLAAGCSRTDSGKPEPADAGTSQEETAAGSGEAALAEPVAEAPEEIRDGYFRSTLTNEWTEDSLKDQRPVAVMINNIEAALPHSGISEAGVIYEAPVEGSLTRLMAVIEDWKDLQRIGPVRSARLYYIYWALEWDAVYCHFGGPKLYVEEMLNEDYVDNLDGLELEGASFFRIPKQGVAKEHTAYTSGEGILKGLEKKGYSRTHTEHNQGAHFRFASEESPVDLSGEPGAVDASYVEPGYLINKPYFKYHPEDGLYYRFQYGDKHMDEVSGRQLSFKNLILQTTYSVTLDAKGYLGFKNHDTTMGGYYITGGKAIPITWKKTDDFGPTRYYNQNGEEITLNTGKTFICIIQENAVDKVVIE